MKRLSALLIAIPAIALAHNVSENIIIIPLSKTNFPESMKKDMQEYNATLKKDGFVSSEDANTRKLYLMRNKKLMFARSSDPAERELKHAVSDISLLFRYKDKVPNPIAYVGVGIERPDGWSGIKTFFDGKKLGTCTLTVFHVGDVKEKIQLNEDGLRYDVSDKPTRLTIEGSHNSGFMYSVMWYDRNFVQNMECANMRYDQSIQKGMIDLAKKIDER